LLVSIALVDILAMFKYSEIALKEESKLIPSYYFEAF